MMHDHRLSMDVERDWVWEEETDQDADTWEDEGLTVQDGPHQVMWD